MSDLEVLLDFYGVDYDGSKTREQSIKCPVHSDSHASASVNLEKELFHCQACGAGGSVYDLVMQKEGLTFEAARAFTETRTGRTDQRGRAQPRARAEVPRGQGYSPRRRLKISTRRRQRPDF